MLGNMGTLILGRAVQAAMSLATFKLLTTFLSPTDVAHYFFAVAASVGFALVLLNPVGMWVNRHVLEWREKYSWPSILSLLVLYHLSVGVMGALVLVVLNEQFKFNPQISKLNLALGVGGILFLQSFCQLVSGLYNIVGSRRSYSLAIASGQVLIFVSAAASILVSEPELQSWLVALAVGNFLASFIFIRGLAREFKGEISARPHDLINWKGILSFCLPVVGVASAAWLQTQGYRIALAKEQLQALAVMAVCLGCVTNIGGILESLIQQYLVPNYYKALNETPGDQASQVWREMFFKAFLFTGLACAGMFAFSPFILRILSSEHYVGGFWIFRWGAILEFVRILSNFVYLSFIGNKKVVRALPAYFTSSLLVLLTFATAPSDSAQIESWVLSGLTIAGLVTLVLLIWRVREHISPRAVIQPLSRVVLYSSPFSIGFFIPPNVGLVWVLLTFVLAGGYALFVLRHLVRRQLL